MSDARPDLRPFDFRVSSGPWRWLLLGTMGAAAGGCFGKAEKEPKDLRGQTATGQDRGTGTPPRSRTGSGGGVSSSSGDCVDPTPLGGGWERCANGIIHRAAVTGECPSQLPRAEGVVPAMIAVLYPNFVAAPDAGAPSPFGPGCLSDADCTARPYGHCDANDFGDGGRGVFCSYGCVSDADCEAGSVCVCGEPIGQCFSSDCTTDADCGGEGMCASYEASPGGPCAPKISERDSATARPPPIR